MFGRKKIRALEDELEDTSQKLDAANRNIEKYGLLEVSELERQIDLLTSEKDEIEIQVDLLRNIVEEETSKLTRLKDANELEEYINSLHSEIDELRANIRTEKAHLVEVNEQRILQEAGIYEYNHPLSTADAYKEALAAIRDEKKEEQKRAAQTAKLTGYTVDGSAAKGKQMIGQTQRLMTEAYNAALQNEVSALKAHTLDRAIDRMNKTRDRIAKNGAVLGIQISNTYHALAIEELKLTADYRVKKEEEKEAQRAERERQREEAAAMKELAAERNRLEKEKLLNVKALSRIAPDALEERRELEVKVQELEDSLHDVERREANTRTGFVYVISNVGAFGEDIVKIGLTRRLDPMDRVRELGDASVPFRFDTHAIIFSHDAVTLEKKLHDRFSDFRVNAVNKRREFFYVTPKEVHDALSEFGTEYVLEFKEDALAYEWRESGGIARREEINKKRYSENSSQLMG